MIHTFPDFEKCQKFRDFQVFKVFRLVIESDEKGEMTRRNKNFIGTKTVKIV